jgi:molybdate-binding protein
MLPPVLIAVDYVGSKEDIIIRGKLDYGFSKISWNNDRKDSDAVLTAVNTGGYKGEFTYSCKLYDMAGMAEYDKKDPDYNVKWFEYLEKTSPDTSYELRFKKHQSGLISCQQLGVIVDSWD